MLRKAGLKIVGVNVVKWGLIGSGDFAQLYAKIFNGLPNVDLVSIYSRTEENAKRAAKEYGIPKWYTNYEKLINSDGVEAIAVVNNELYHHGPVMAALQARKHVILEKPIAPSLKEADEMIEAAKKTDKLFLVAHILPFHTNFAMAKTEIDKGVVGEICSIYARRNAPAKWGAEIQKRSSAIYDEMIHDVECVLWFTNNMFKLKKVYAQTKNVRGLLKPDICWAMLTFDNGMIVTLEANWFLPDNTPYNSAMESRMEIHGNKGMIYIDLGSQGLAINDEKGWRTPDTTWWPEKLGRIEGALGDEIRYFADFV
ncbi:MAG: Gfo/Idh/MocA family oxidoreductase, partial [Actinomycetota bacterium]|nr:Gfo/Idh/MocA family oxidoreductase [Actinomycetota bacterium]